MALVAYIHLFVSNMKAHTPKSWFLNDLCNKTFNFASLVFIA